MVLLASPMLSMIDSSVVNVAVPVIVTDLHTTLATAAWALSGYLLGLSITERLSGSFGIALLATYYAQRVRITGVPVAAFHDCAAALAAAAAAGALAALGLRRGTMGTPPV